MASYSAPFAKPLAAALPPTQSILLGPFLARPLLAAPGAPVWQTLPACTLGLAAVVVDRVAKATNLSVFATDVGSHAVRSPPMVTAELPFELR